MMISECHSNRRDCIYFVYVLFGRASKHIRWDICRDSMMRTICTPKTTKLHGISCWNIFGNGIQNRFLDDLNIHVLNRNVTAQPLFGCYKLNLKKDRKQKKLFNNVSVEIHRRTIVIIMECTLNDFHYILNPIQNVYNSHAFSEFFKPLNYERNINGNIHTHYGCIK